MNQPQAPSFSEDRISQIPALQLLINLGFEYLTPEDVYNMRGKRLSNVILDEILAEQLRKFNRVRHKGKAYPFTEGNIHAAVEALKSVPYDGLVRTNEQIYDLLCLGKSLPQTIEGDTKSFSLKYIDWDNPGNNVYHCTAEFKVERAGSYETRRPDIVLFVNGIPLVVIECKRPDIKEPIEHAIRQQIRNQMADQIPGLFVFSQLLLGLATDEAKYATTNTPEKFWSGWKEEFTASDVSKIRTLCNTALSDSNKDKLFSDPFKDDRNYMERLRAAGEREPTTQDQLLYALCRPKRLLELAYRYIVFDAGVKKIARYQQYFCVEKIMGRVTNVSGDRTRQGGVVWHTQGSGKSLTMVMLAKALSLEDSIQNPRIVLVTDRVDLDDQIYRTFHSCGKLPVQAATGANLVELLRSSKEQIITTVIDKFEAATSKEKVTIDDPNIFVLVDEGHRTQYKERHARMRKTLPAACFISFTGTPIVKKNKNTIERFGGLIDTYTITQATKDKAVVELLYEGRHVPQDVDADEIDSWFEKLTDGLSDEQKADLKKKFANTDQLNIAERKIARIAWDISVHYRDNWQGTGFKGQLVAQRKEAALLYKKYLDEFEMVTAEVLISGPDDYEVDEDDTEDSKTKVANFWKKMMDRFGSEKEYNKQLIAAFKGPDDPEIIIVVDKLLTGFDAPRNTILYLTRKLREHTLLQAIARVNRLHDGKDFGYIIDYRGVLAELDEALDLYSSLPEFDAEDLKGIWRDVAEEIAHLPQAHEAVWDVFKEVENKQDVEALERHLFDEERRNTFYERFSEFARSLGIALSSVKFLEDTPEGQIAKYKIDLKFFKNLRYAVRRRYADVIEFSEYEQKIQKLIDRHVGASEVETVTEQVNIFDKDAFAEEVGKVVEPSAKADTIAHRTMKTISERMGEDPVFYMKFSRMLQAVIDAFRDARISANEYLEKSQEIRESIVNRKDDDMPPALEAREVAKAFFRSLKEALSDRFGNQDNHDKQLADAALGVEDILESNRIVNWVNDSDRRNQMWVQLDDYLHDFKNENGVRIDFEQIDEIIEQCLRIFESRRA